MSDAANGSAPAGNPAPGAGDGGAAGGAADWTTSFPDEIRGVIQTKGWKNPGDVIASYSNLERLLGADKAGRGVVLPKDDASADEWSAFYQRLGRPESVDGYKIQVPDGDTGAFAKTAAQWFHEAGLTTKQAETLAAKWNEYSGSTMQQQESQFEQQSAIDLQDLQKSWGDKFEANAELARRARREAGLSDEDGQAIERALGLKKAAEVFAFLGKQFAEAPMKGGEGASRGQFGATPEDARARIAALKNDKDWTARYLNGDVEARSEFERLHRIAFPSAA
jgi:hypothetical protein|nr:MAG TPA: hypothetical protein [Caudoviricetes sp.]